MAICTSLELLRQLEVSDLLSARLGGAEGRVNESWHHIYTARGSAQRDFFTV